MKRQLLPLLIALTLTAGVSGCTAVHSGTGTTPPDTSVVFDRGGTVVVAVSSLPSNFNPSTPAGANSVTSEVMAQVWPQTFVTDEDLSTSVEAGFVEEAEVESISPFTVVYTLNPKAVWSDGVPIGVTDFIYNWREQVAWGAELPNSGLLAGYQAISSITSTNGGSTVHVTFSHPFTEWEALFSNLVPAHIGEVYGWVGAFEGFSRARVVSGGPFEITSYVPGVRLELSRNPKYWYTPARVAHILLEVEPASKAVSNLRVGLVNVAETPDSAQVDDLVANAARVGVALTADTSNLPALWELSFNTTAPVVASDDFRLGVAESLDVAALADDSVGLVETSAAPYENRLLLGDTSSSSGSASGNGGSTSVVTGDYDPVAALSSFLAAGYVPAPDGSLEATVTGAPVTLSLDVPRGNTGVAEAASAVQAELGAMGIRVTLRHDSLKSMLATILPMGEYQMALAPYGLTPFAAAETPIYSSSVLPVSGDSIGREDSLPHDDSLVRGDGGGTEALGVEPGAATAGFVTRDVSGLDDPIVDTDLADALTNLSSTADLTYLNAANTQLSLDMPTIPLFEEPVTIVHSSDVRAVTESPTPAGIFWDAQLWEIQSNPPVVASSVPPAAGQPDAG